MARYPLESVTVVEARVANMDAVDEIVSMFTTKVTKEKLFELLMRHRVPSAPVRDLNDVLNDPHMLARHALDWIDHPDLGRIPVPNSPMRCEGVNPMPIVPSPRLGEDNKEVYGMWLGTADDEIGKLRDQGMI